MITSKHTIRQVIRHFGYDFHQFDPNLNIKTFLWSLFQKFEINYVLDVGARMGEYGKELRENNFKGHIFSFEPVSSNYKQLEQTANQDPLWHTYNYALGSQNTTANINVPNFTNFSSFLQPNEFSLETFPISQVEQTEVVNVNRLDEVFGQIFNGIKNPRIYLKMDTQGWDLEVFRGTEKYLNNIIAIQSELSLIPIYDGMPGWIEALKEYKEAGFEPAGLFPVTRNSDWRLIEVDCVMVRKDYIQAIPQ